MANIVQMYRLPSAQASVHTGPVGQIIVDTDTKAIRIQDGVTPGGFVTLLASSNLSDLADKVAARTALGLGTAATHASTDFDPAGSASTVQGLAVLKTNNLSDLPSASTARTNLGLGTAATLGAGNNTTKVPVLGAIIGNNRMIYNSGGTDTGVLLDAGFAYTDVTLNSSNLSGLGSASTARTNLGLGTAATAAKSGNTSVVASLGTIATNRVPYIDASGNLSDTGYSIFSLQTFLINSNNLSDVSSAATARTNLGLGSAATQSSSAFDASGAAAAVLASSCQKANNLSDVANPTTALNNLGYTAATVTFSSLSSNSHGSTTAPFNAAWITAQLQCTATDASYSVGDKVIAPITNDQAAAKGLVAWCNSSLVGYSISNNGVQIYAKNTSTMTDLDLTKWALLIRLHT